MRLTSAVRIGLVIVLSVTIAWIGTVALFYLSADGGTRNTRPLPAQVAALVVLLEQSSPAQRPWVLRAVTSQTLTARLEPGFHIAVTPRLQRVPRLTARAVNQYLAALGGRPNSVTVSREHGGQGGLGFSFATPVDLELRVGLATGETLVVDALQFPVTNIFGLPVGFVAGLTGAVIGLIALLALQREAAFNRLQVRLSYLVRGRIALLGGISHDVRTFLTRLRLRVERIPDEEERERAIADIADMLHLLDDALLASRAGAGELAEELVDFAQVVRAEMEDREAAGKRVDLRVGGTTAGGWQEPRAGAGAGAGEAGAGGASHGPIVATRLSGGASTLPRDRVPMSASPPPNTTVLGDRLALRRVIANLVDNALTYGKAAHLSIDADSEFVTLIVDDEGPGIPADQREAILEPFVRLEDSRNRRTGGAGLGLAVARSLIEAHGGTISIADAPGAGARVTVRLPLFVAR
jgi:signal transduction histidine kinase